MGTSRTRNEVRHHMTPQWQSIYRELKKGRKVTPYSALKLCGCLRLSERIREAERYMGVVVKRDWKRVNKRTMVRQYSL